MVLDLLVFAICRFVGFECGEFRGLVEKFDWSGVVESFSVVLRPVFLLSHFGSGALIYFRCRGVSGCVVVLVVSMMDFLFHSRCLHLELFYLLLWYGTTDRQPVEHTQNTTIPDRQPKTNLTQREFMTYDTSTTRSMTTTAVESPIPTITTASRDHTTDDYDTVTRTSGFIEDEEKVSDTEIMYTPNEQDEQSHTIPSHIMITHLLPENITPNITPQMKTSTSKDKMIFSHENDTSVKNQDSIYNHWSQYTSDKS